MKDGLDALCGGGGLHECTFNMGSRIFAVTIVPRLSRMGSTRLQMCGAYLQLSQCCMQQHYAACK